MLDLLIWIAAILMAVVNLPNNYFLSLVSECQHSILSRAPSVSMYCHLLYAFLQDTIVCQLKDVTTLLATKGSPIPLEVPLLDELLGSNNKGAVMYFRNKQCLEKSWILVKTEIILKDVNGVLFAPEHCKQHCKLASNTGIVRISDLKEVFPQYDPEMLVELLVSLEFCIPVSLNNAATADHFETDQLLFFPALSKTTERQQDFTKEIQQLSEQQIVSGWCLGCGDDLLQNFTVKFIYTLIFRLINASLYPLLYLVKNCHNVATFMKLDEGVLCGKMVFPGRTKMVSGQ